MEDLFDLPPDRLMLLALFATMGLVALFALAVLARMWGARMRHGGGGATKGLDLEDLNRQRREGRITEEEYAAIARRVAGGGGPSAAPPEKPIK